MHWPKDIVRVGVEASEYSAEIAKARGLDIKKDFLQNIEFDNKFDVVTCYAIMSIAKSARDLLKLLNI